MSDSPRGRDRAVPTAAAAVRARLPQDRRIGHPATTLEVGREPFAARPGGERLAQRIGGFRSVGLAHTAARALPGRSR